MTHQKCARRGVLWLTKEMRALGRARLRGRLRPGRWAGLVGSDGWPRMAGLTMARSRAVTKANATRCKRAGKPLKGLILGELSATMGWHRNHAGRHSRRR